MDGPSNRRPKAEGVAIPGTAAADAAALLTTELTTEWQRKGSLETRALSAVTVNISFLALYFALWGSPEESTAMLTPLHVIGFGFIASSILCALGASLPANYGTPAIEGFEEFVRGVVGGTTTEADVLVDTLETRVAQLRSARKANDWKGWLAMASLGFLALGGVFLVGAAVIVQ